ncbi:hypothetical protein [Caudoviricetes sp.]|nr:hypothetical protein [Caudoviricetes sp.]UOF81514.1 hypothetical protein [Caudoviricetes sp.]
MREKAFVRHGTQDTPVLWPGLSIRQAILSSE